MSETKEPARSLRKSFACDECKRRKIRCSGGESCASCSRDKKRCQYSSPSQRLGLLQRYLRNSEARCERMKKAWELHLPKVDLEAALNNLPQSPKIDADDNVLGQISPHLSPASHAENTSLAADNRPPEADDEASADQITAIRLEHSNAEDYEFDESHDAERSIDGMAFLTSDPHKAGYTGPQSGIAALKFLQSLPPYLPITYSSPLSGSDDRDVPPASSQSTAAIRHYIDQYFALYHPAYPILHEGTFRARVSGALGKPQDGSWPLLYNAVLALGAFVSGPNSTKCDYPFYKEARRHLSMDILEKGSLGYVQGLTLFANYLQKRDKPNGGFLLIGIAFNMALAIGLHREFDVSNTSPFTMEIRRRAWWTLFVFVSGAHLSLGRPAASLVGVNVQLPANLDDDDLAVDMEKLPPEKASPASSSCLIAQVKLAIIANKVHDELLTHRRPSYALTKKLGEDIRLWSAGLPPYFDENAMLEPRFEFPKRVLLWRSFNLRIILNRPFVVEAIVGGTELSLAVEPIKSCLDAADECVTSVSAFIKSIQTAARGFAWYATAWLITASFMQATCLIYSPEHSLAAKWRESLQQAVECLQVLGSSHDMALRAREILQSALGNHGVLEPFGSALSQPSTFQVNQAGDTLSPVWFEDGFNWLAQGADGMDHLAGAGSLMYGHVFDGS